MHSYTCVCRFLFISIRCPMLLVACWTGVFARFVRTVRLNMCVRTLMYERRRSKLIWPTHTVLTTRVCTTLNAISTRINCGLEFQIHINMRRAYVAVQTNEYANSRRNAMQTVCEYDFLLNAGPTQVGEGEERRKRKKNSSELFISDRIFIHNSESGNRQLAQERMCLNSSSPFIWHAYEMEMDEIMRKWFVGSARKPWVEIKCFWSERATFFSGYFTALSGFAQEMDNLVIRWVLFQCMRADSHIMCLSQHFV